MKELIVGKEYILKHTGSFCHALGSNGIKDFSKNLNSEDTVRAMYVGTVPSYLGERDIFYAPNNPKRMYLMFSADNRDYIDTKKI